MPLPPQPLRRPGGDAADRAPLVLLLSLWAAPGAAWHARLVEADAQVHEFDSPFELARFLAQAGALRARETSGGLR